MFNYQNHQVKANVFLMKNLINFDDNNSDQFDFINDNDDGNNIDNNKETNLNDLKQITSLSTTTSWINPMDCAVVNFMIKPKKLGFIDIKIKATCDNAGDAILKKLLVKPEGQTLYFNRSMFVRMLGDSNKTLFKRRFYLDIPKRGDGIVPGSERIKVSGISDILGPTVNHIDDLLRMPYGCGEQNMM